MVCQVQEENTGLSSDHSHPFNIASTCLYFSSCVGVILAVDRWKISDEYRHITALFQK
jgi:hypothetical protein